MKNLSEVLKRMHAVMCTNEGDAPQVKEESAPDTFQQSSPTCPHCGYALDEEDMFSNFSKSDLFDLPSSEEQAEVNCPQCDMSYWVQGGYRPHYTSAFDKEML